MREGSLNIPRATIGRLPAYLAYLKHQPTPVKHVSSASIAKELGRGEVQVRKDLHAVSGTGRPRIGYVKKDLIKDIERVLGINNRTSAVLVGAGKLGRALLEFEGFAEYGIEIIAAFDISSGKIGERHGGIVVYDIERLRHFCHMHNVEIGIICVPKEEAQAVCDQLVGSGVGAVWNFSPTELLIPDNVALKNENLALSLAQLRNRMRNEGRIVKTEAAKAAAALDASARPSRSCGRREGSVQANGSRGASTRLGGEQADALKPDGEKANEGRMGTASDSVLRHAVRPDTAWL